MSRIRTYVRLRPQSPSSSPSLWYRPEKKRLHIDIAEDVNLNRFGRKGKVQHEFEFTHVFDTPASQDELFCEAASDVVESFLHGYNATVFAYGQTGSGKTHTIEGSYKRFSDRGIIPRALAMIYQSLETRTEEEIKVQISYLEIYQENGYDLLNPGLQHSGLVTRLPKVTIFQADQNNIVFKNLSIHLAANEEIARSLLFQGRTNRKVAETPMNKRSSRSHAIFSIYLTAKPKDSPVIVTSKLHLVDLAGSERVAKTKVKGHVLQEAKYINLSLHHLEHVIVALQKGSQDELSSKGYRQGKNRYVPYRNSMLTTVLRDSIGGNCMTVMIAALSVEESNVWESISTCRFAQRVACIANPVRRNEILDDKETIKRLKKRINELENEVAILKQEKRSVTLSATENDERDSLSDEEKKLCKKVMTSFVSGNLDNPVASGINSSNMFRECLRLLKSLITNLLERASDAPVGASQPSTCDSAFEQVLLPHLMANTENSNSRSSSKTSGFDSERGSHDSTPSLTTPSVSDSDAQWTASKRRVAWESTTTKTLESLVHKSRTLEKSTDISDENPHHSHSQRRELYMSSLEGRKQAAIEKKSKKLDIIKQRQQEETARLTLRHLQLLEENYEGKLDEAREQIARQHARIVALKRQNAGDTVIGPESLAQQQLQLKEEKLYYQLQEVRQKLKQVSHFQKTRDSALLVSSSNQARLAVDSRTVLQQLRKEKEESDKIAQHLNDVKLSQMEQQLALKEEATRRKLLAFKQQLQFQPQQKQLQTRSYSETETHADDKINHTDKTDIHAATEDRLQTGKYSKAQRATNNEIATERRHSEIKGANKLSLEMPHSRHVENEFDKTLSSNKDANKASNLDGTADELYLASGKKNATNNHNRSFFLKSSTFGHLFDSDLAVVKRSSVSLKSPANAVLTDVDRKTTDDQTVARVQSREDDFDKIKFEESRFVRKSRRAIPENESEKQYVSAAAKHKERVERIRKAMRAAIIIQRSWRRYRQK